MHIMCRNPDVVFPVYADDTIMLGESKDELMKLLRRVKMECEVSGEWRGYMNIRFALGRIAMSGLTKMCKDEDVIKQTKRRLVNDLLSPVAMYRCESQTVKKNGGKKIDSLEIFSVR